MILKIQSDLTLSVVETFQSPTSRGKAAVAMIGGQLLITAGGVMDGHKLSSSADVYDKKSKKWLVMHNWYINYCYFLWL